MPNRRFIMPIHRVALVAFLGWSSPAWSAGTSSDAARAAARTAANEGISALEAGDFSLAVQKLERAYGVVRVPTLGLWYARALAKAGKLVEASERYREVIGLEITEGKIKDQKKAQVEATAELEALKPRIPLLVITVRGVSEDSEVTLDGVSVPTKLLGLETPTNPGQHLVRVQRRGQRAEQSVILAEGEKKTVELEVKSAEASPLSEAQTPEKTSSPSDASSSFAEQSSGAPSRSAGSTQATVGWIGLGLGGVATAVGAVTGAIAMSKRKQLDDSGQCSGTKCSAEVDDLREGYNQMRTLSTIGFIVGAVGVGTGITLLLTTPKTKEAATTAQRRVDSDANVTTVITTPKPRDAAMTAYLGIGYVGIRGSF